jgi:DNA-binding response OmpR family regulator
METALTPTLKLRTLAGKRMCIVGFRPNEAMAIRNALESAEAFCRIVGADSDHSALSAFDVAFVQVDEMANRDWLRESRKAETIPVLMLGGLTTIMDELSQLPTEAADFLLADDWSSGELLVRTLKLLRKGAAFTPATKRAQPLILIVDDDNAVVSLLGSVLKKAGMECHVARDGTAGIEMATQLKPDLMIVDVNMPNRNGFDVLKILKQSPETASIRVLLLTGCEQEADVLRGFGLGADDYVTKPFNPLEIGARVRSLLVRPR